MIKTIEWKPGFIRIIDQTLLPGALKYEDIKDIGKLWKAIKVLKVRGAPALGAAGALGVYLGIKDFKGASAESLRTVLEKAGKYIGSSRPTAINLFFGINRMRACLEHNLDKSVPALKRLLLKEALAVMQEDRDANALIGKYGSVLLHNGDGALTICNAGALATIGQGTALSVFYSAKARGKRFKVYACETRPLLQGARLTAWELMRNKIDVTLICDSMAADVMRKGLVKLAVAGADRIALNGDSANKIGTYSLAVLCAYHKIPFYIAAPLSTIDFACPCGARIPIEERDPREITSLFFKKDMAPKGCRVYNPAFDVTPAKLIAGIITEKGILRPPFSQAIAKLKR